MKFIDGINPWHQTLSIKNIPDWAAASFLYIMQSYVILIQTLNTFLLSFKA